MPRCGHAAGSGTTRNKQRIQTESHVSTLSTTPKTPAAAGDDTTQGDTGLRKGLTNYGDRGFSLFLRKAFIKGSGYTDSALDRPVIGIADTGSAFNPCHGNMPQLVEAVKRGIMLAGGLPMEFPTISIHESFAAPTSMYLRNLMSMDTEEMIRAQPMDAVVLIGGCDKTVPAQLMGAASAGVPAIQLVTGAMLTATATGASSARARSMPRKPRRSTTSSSPAWEPVR